MKATRAARKAAIIEAGMKVHAVLKASLKAQPPTQPSLKNLQKTCMKFVNDLEEFALDKFAHDSPKDVKADSLKDVKATVEVVRQRVRIVVARERWRRDLHREAMQAARAARELHRESMQAAKEPILAFCKELVEMLTARSRPDWQACRQRAQNKGELIVSI